MFFMSVEALHHPSLDKYVNKVALFLVKKKIKYFEQKSVG